MAYSTVGGKVSNTSRVMRLFSSRFLSSFDRILSDIPSTSFDIPLNLLGPVASENKISSFHFPSRASKASRIDIMFLGHPPRVSIRVYVFVIHYYPGGKRFPAG